jgi:hypothetical protein
MISRVHASGYVRGKGPDVFWVTPHQLLHSRLHNLQFVSRRATQQRWRSAGKMTPAKSGFLLIVSKYCLGNRSAELTGSVPPFLPCS